MDLQILRWGAIAVGLLLGLDIAASLLEMRRNARGSRVRPDPALPRTFITIRRCEACSAILKLYTRGPDEHGPAWCADCNAQREQLAKEWGVPDA